MTKTEKVLCLNDLHIPYHDVRTLNAVFQFIIDQKPNTIILNGDIVDFAALARFDKSMDMESGLQNEIEQTQEFLHDLRKHSGKKCKIIYVGGNHDRDRLAKYVTKNAKHLEFVEALKLDKILDMKKFNIKYVDDRYYVYKGIMFSHLDKVTQNPGGAAKSLGLKFMCDVVHGHTHHVNHMQYADYNFIENGCLCDVQQEYVVGPSTFKQAITMIHIRGKQKYYQLIPINKHQFYYGNKRYFG